MLLKDILFEEVINDKLNSGKFHLDDAATIIFLVIVKTSKVNKSSLSWTHTNISCTKTEEVFLSIKQNIL